MARGLFSAPLVALLTTAVLVTPAAAQVTRSYDANAFASRTSALGGPGSTGAATSLHAAFAGVQAEGVWTLRVTDGGGRAVGTAGQAFLTLATSIAPGVPTANDDHLATPAGTRIYVSAPGVLANDTHDASGFMTATLLTAPSGGVVTLDPTGRLDYTPNAGFTGRDQFTYQATNMVGPSAPAMVTIDVAPPPTLPSGVTATTSRRADPALLGPIPRSTLQILGEKNPDQCMGGGLTVPLRIDDPLRVRNVRVSITASIASIGNLWMVLTPPRGPVQVIASAFTGRPASAATLAGTLTFSDDASNTLWAAITGPTVPPGTYRGHDFSAAATTISEPDQPSAGVWTLQVYEYCNSGPQGSVQDLSIEIEGVRATEIDADPTSLGAIPDGGAGPRQPGPPRDVRFTVPPGRGTVQTVAVDLAFAHPAIGQVVAELLAPDGTPHVLFGNLGSYGGGSGYLDAVSDALTFSDRARARWGDGSLPFRVSTRTSGLQGRGMLYTPTVMDAAFSGRLAEGTWILRLTDGDAGGTGTVSAATLVLLTSVSPTAPSSLRVSNVDAHVVTLRWQPPAVGTPVAYVVEAGVAPGQTLVTLPVGATPLLTVTAPPGVFHARVRAVEAGVASPPSNEVRLVVQTPEAPSAPASLAAVVDGNTVSLSWQNTFGGGPPTGLALDVSGAAAATIPLPLAETMTAGGVPPGTYNLAVRATNASGSSAASNPVTIAVPATCTAAPGTPSAFLAYATGSVVQLLWDAPTGAATTGYALTVSGGYTGTFPLAARSVSGALPPGTYTFSVVAQNACGSSAPAPAQTLVLP